MLDSEIIARHMLAALREISHHGPSSQPGLVRMLLWEVIILEVRQHLNELSPLWIGPGGSKTATADVVDFNLEVAEMPEGGEGCRVTIQLITGIEPEGLRDKLARLVFRLTTMEGEGTVFTGTILAQDVLDLEVVFEGVPTGDYALTCVEEPLDEPV